MRPTMTVVTRLTVMEELEVIVVLIQRPKPVTKDVLRRKLCGLNVA